MADKLSENARSANMAAIRSKDTKPEMIVRRLVHSHGYRYRLHRKELPGKPDLVFGPRKKVIFVHGCFWHQHNDPDCLDGRLPKSRLDYWLPKLERNQQRDSSNQRSLESSGWKVLIIWDCETKEIAALEMKIKAFLD
ncbi:very short patch repair endonuclease [Hoeflea alexandrii]|uniref:Very short patch repair endonuclease n=1 Tax=Hoeflea alexandrii TaxID=288436 RepID=A0ABT1CM48_9HYPH|nr:DNA mismatch endonuclease Vsr [Hoeflea alexandrii]MCO6407295.1 DNA mismatch endonuclease Vsr [Hoeflea alexandrii]MCY0154304.1 DNA mismatch endonuclease Vsr [Hoeflea alexandrii]